MNGKSNVPLPQRHQIVDTKPGRDALIVVEHQLPGTEIQQYITDDIKISQVPQGDIRQSKFETFKMLTYVNIRLIISETHFQNQQLQQWWADNPPLVDHFGGLVQQSG